MSRYCTVTTEFRDDEALISALMETSGWSLEQIECHQIPKHLLGFQGDRRKEVAHVIIRRKHVGRNSNDLGFVKAEDGSFRAIISDYDKRKYGEKWMATLKGNYAFHTIKRQQEQRGRRVKRSRCSRTNRQRIEITGYR